ncbi:MAG TPA: YifB family Mg chelatase-like AAA ATPase [Spirochaetota bacterium]|mgnify:CR=1 FL=1|nr:YifB family Mg chelatase-like AAA ATPase [Spirochaetota bacterium]HOL57669.1 YifB family Mg chelatase-like AAA ATPase [Spirochaetota bacterium]HPP04759.1 YifB family Mg chelatase-like AAA ATPase [Spirochaetota bacterium]
MVGKCWTFSRNGLNCSPVEVEVDIKNGLPVILVTGLLSQEVKEARERVRPAISNSGLEFPVKRVTINLSPAETIKIGTHYDLAIAVALLKACGYLQNITERIAFFGELNLSGEIKWVRGILPMVLEAIKENFEKIVIPYENFNEIAFLNHSNIIAAESINDMIEKLVNNINQSEKETLSLNYFFKQNSYGDYQDIMGQKEMVEAFKIAAAGLHHMLIIGPPGSGKTMGASRLPSIMPDLTEEEIFEINKIYSIAAMLQGNNWVTVRPFRSPHNSFSVRAIVGGGPKVLPGEVSLAHKGILFLDELLEFRNDTLQSLRTIIEKKEVYISLRNGCAVYPADFLLVTACNPCPCGYFGTKSGICNCSMNEVKKYRRKLKNPLIDRIDIQLQIDRVNYKNLINGEKNESSEAIKEKVLMARDIQEFRYRMEDFKLNSLIPSEKISFYCKMTEDAEKSLENFMEQNLLTARACHKILRIARTIADLEKKELIEKYHIDRAIGFRILDTEIM